MYKIRLKEALELRGISVAMLAAKVGTERTNIYKYLRGDTTPKLEINRKIAEALHIDANWLAGCDVPMTPIDMDKKRGVMFAQRLREALQNKGMRPSTLAYRLELDRSTISNYMNGKYRPKREMHERIAEILNVNPDWLAGYDVPMIPTIKTQFGRVNMFAKRLKEALEYRNMRNSTLAYRIGVDRSMISNYLSGRCNPKRELHNKIAEVLKIDPDWLAGDDVPMLPQERSIRPRNIVPVLGYVAAGIPIDAISDILDYEELSPDMVKDGAEYFALQIKGDSMAPRINTGDVVIVRKQEDVDSGQIAIVCVNGDQATCKRIIKQPAGILLQPINQAYQPVFYTVEQVHTIPITILGRVVELRAKF